MIGSWLSFVILYFGPPQPVFYLAFMLWGCAGGISMSMSRSIVQSSAPPSHQARISSIYQLAMMGGGPIGALASGFLIKQFGVLNSILFPVVCIFIWWFVMLFVSPIWSIKRIPHEPAPEELKATADAAPTTFAP
jgi:MFS family permease